MEVIETVRAVTGREVPYRFGERRPGDPAVLVAGSRAHAVLGWNPVHSSMHQIVDTAWRWYLKKKARHLAG